MRCFFHVFILIFSIFHHQHAHAQNWTTVSASNITDLNQVKLPSGRLCFLGTDLNDKPVNFQVGGGGQVLARPFCSNVSNGVVTSFTVPNPANTSPIGIVYRVTVVDSSTGQQVLLYKIVAFLGTTFNFDNYIPGFTTTPTGQQVTGNLLVTGCLQLGLTDTNLGRGGVDVLNVGSSCGDFHGAISAGSLGLFSGPLTLGNSGTATAGQNFGSGTATFSQSVWNGSSAQLESWNINAFENASGTNPTSYISILFNNQLNRQAQPGFLLLNGSAATVSQNYNGPYLQFVSPYWNGSASTSDFWTLTPTLGTGTNPTSTLVVYHIGSSGLSAFKVPNLQILNLGSTTTPSIVWTANGLTNWGLNQDFGTGELVTVENGVNVAQLGHQMTVQAAGEFSWVSGSNASSLGWDTTLYRDSAGIVGVGAGTHTPVGSFKASHIYAMTGGSFNGTFADDPTSPNYILGHVGGSAATLKMSNGFQLAFISSINASTGTVDSCLARAGVGVVKLTSDCGGGTPVNTAVLVGRYLLGNENITLANGLNSDIQTATSPNDSYYEFTGPTAAFSIGGFVPSTSGFKSGQLLKVFNDTSQQMTIVNLDAGTTAGNRILTLTGANVVLRTGNSFASFIYSPIQGAWILTSSN